MFKRLLLTLAFSSSIIWFGSCAQKSQTTANQIEKAKEQHAAVVEQAQQQQKQLEEKTRKLQEENQQLQAQIQKLQEEKKELEKQKAQIAKIQKFQNVKAENLQSAQCEINPDLGVPLNPPQAKPGECFAIGYLPPQYKYEKVKVLVDAGGEKVITTPPKYKVVPKKVLVKEASKKIIVIPPVYKTVTEKVLVRPATTKKVVVRPAKYKWVTEKVLVEPAKKVWKRGRSFLTHAVATRFDPNTGDILCLVEVPPKYKYIKKKVMVEPPVVKEVQIPPVYKTITKKVLVKPAQTKEIVIPAVYKTVYVKELVEPAKVQKIEIPPKYDYVTKRVKVKDEQFLWVKVLCKDNMTKDTIVKLQKALKSKGYYRGPIDGIYGPLTQEAVVNFQRDNNIPITPGAVTLKTLQLLGIQ